MKHFILFLVSICCVWTQSCAQNKKEIEIIETFNTLKLQTANPYAVYFNDIPVDKEYGSGSNTIEIPINDLALKSGLQQIDLILWPNSGDTLIDESEFTYLNVQLLIYPHGMESFKRGEFEVAQTFNKGSFEALPKYKKSWTIDLDLNYEVEGWSNSEYLNSVDSNVLREEVLSFYKNMASIINSGDIKKFNVLNAKRDAEVAVSFSNNEEFKIEDDEFVLNRLNNSKGNVKAMEECVLKIYGNGRVVSLETETGESPLFAEDDREKYTYTFYLHRPKGSKDFEIIR